jgi:hypothetical protein
MKSETAKVKSTFKTDLAFSVEIYLVLFRIRDYQKIQVK